MKCFNDLLHIKKAEPTLSGKFAIQKAVDEQRLAFGWGSVAIRQNGEQIHDHEDDMIDPEDLENAVYQYIELYRDGGERHIRGGVGHIVESVVFTKEKMNAMGLVEDALPVGWWLGFRVTDDSVWEKVKSGEYSMFSIEGEAVREPVEKSLKKLLTSVDKKDNIEVEKYRPGQARDGHGRFSNEGKGGDDGRGSDGGNTNTTSRPIDSKGRAYRHPTHKLPSKEYSKVVHEIDTNYYARFEGKRKSVIYIKDHKYLFEIHDYNEYNIYKKQKIE